MRRLPQKIKLDKKGQLASYARRREGGGKVKPEPKFDLELVATEDLIKELLNRHDHAVFGSMKIGEAPNQSRYAWRWKGNSHTCAGIGMHLAKTILDDFEVDAAMNQKEKS
jgi:hypothetical protein